VQYHNILNIQRSLHQNVDGLVIRKNKRKKSTSKELIPAVAAAAAAAAAAVVAYQQQKSKTMFKTNRPILLAYSFHFSRTKTTYAQLYLVQARHVSLKIWTTKNPQMFQISMHGSNAT